MNFRALCTQRNFSLVRHFFFHKKAGFNNLSRYIHSISNSQTEGSYETVLNSIKQHSQPDSRLLLGYTCKICNNRTYRSISKLAYSKGIVIVSCRSPCVHKHLIADHLGWFKDWNSEGNTPVGTIEDILKQKDENISTNFDPVAWKDSCSATMEHSDQTIQIIPPNVNAK